MRRNSQKKAANYAAWILLLVFFIVFGVFIYLITRPSELEVAKKEVQLCKSVDELESVWKAHPTLHDSTLAIPVKNRALELSSDSLQLTRVIQFLPARPIYLNLIVVPDLSRRIIDTINNPDQISSDKKVLNAIYKKFEERVKFRQNVKDRLLIDITDQDQALGQFRKIADSLLFDPFVSSDFTNRKYFDRKVGAFPKYIDSLYSLAVKKPLGADFHNYFSRVLPLHIRKSNVFEEYRNIVIIVTDGYLEAEDKLYTGASFELAKVCTDWKKGLPLESSIDSSRLWIPNISEKYTSTEVYLFEVNERKGGKKCDFDILKVQWKKWLTDMGVKNVQEPFFFQRENANAHIEGRISEIISER